MATHTRPKPTHQVTAKQLVDRVEAMDFDEVMPMIEEYCHKRKTPAVRLVLDLLYCREHRLLRDWRDRIVAGRGRDRRQRSLWPSGLVALVAAGLACAAPHQGLCHVHLNHLMSGTAPANWLLSL